MRNDKIQFGHKNTGSENNRLSYDRVLEIVPAIPIDTAVELITLLIDCPKLDVRVRYIPPYKIPPGKDGYIEHDKGQKDKAYIVVRDDIPVQHKIWVIGHELLHHKQRYDLWPPEEGFVETMELLLMYGLRGVFHMSQKKER